MRVNECCRTLTVRVENAFLFYFGLHYWHLTCTSYTAGLKYSLSEFYYEIGVYKIK